MIALTPMTRPREDPNQLLVTVSIEDEVLLARGRAVALGGRERKEAEKGEISLPVPVHLLFPEFQGELPLLVDKALVLVDFS